MLASCTCNNINKAQSPKAAAHLAISDDDKNVILAMRLPYNLNCLVDCWRKACGTR